MQISVYTDAHHLMGTLDTLHTRLTDVLIQEGVEYVAIRDCLAVPFAENIGEDRLLPYVQVSREQILFAIEHTSIRPPSPASSGEFRLPNRLPGIRVVKHAHRIGATIATWEIEGNVHLLPGAPMKETLMALRDSFLPLTDAFAINLAHPRFRLGPETLIVNRERLNFLWIVE
jgi:hypothetical protein